MCRTLPERNALVLSSCRWIRSGAVRNSDLPAPSTTGATMIRSSSTRPSPSRLTVRSELPKTAMSLPGCCLSLVSSPATSSSTIRVLAQSASRSVRDTTSLGSPFIFAATLGSSCCAAGVGQ